MTPASFLLDTNLISELSRARPDPRVIAFFDTADRLVISVMVLHELRYGFEALTDPARRARLDTFMRMVADRFGPAALPVDGVIAISAACMRASAKKAGRVLTIADSLVAATSVTHGLTLATRNVKDFADLDVPLFDPFLGP